MGCLSPDLLGVLRMNPCSLRMKTGIVQGQESPLILRHGSLQSTTYVLDMLPVELIALSLWFRQAGS